MDNISKRYLVPLSLSLCVFLLCIFCPLPNGNQSATIGCLISVGPRPNPSSFSISRFAVYDDQISGQFTKPCIIKTNCMISYLGHIRNSLHPSHRSHFSRSRKDDLLWRHFSLPRAVTSITYGISFIVQEIEWLALGRTMGYEGAHELEPCKEYGRILIVGHQAKYLSFFHYPLRGYLIYLVGRSTRHLHGPQLSRYESSTVSPVPPFCYPTCISP